MSPPVHQQQFLIGLLSLKDEKMTVSHKLIDEQKNRRVDWCRFMIGKFDEGEKKNLDGLLTGDEIWLYNFDPKTKRQSILRCFENGPTPTKCHRTRNTQKQMVAMFFWPDLPYGFLGFSPGPRGVKGLPAKSSQPKIDDMRKNSCQCRCGLFMIDCAALYLCGQASCLAKLSAPVQASNALLSRGIKTAVGGVKNDISLALSSRAAQEHQRRVLAKREPTLNDNPLLNIHPVKS
ncbi:hypothetical protein EVAR_64045_1 [Eumeta japonica]|uniref:Mariner Mos1 transposase n=1 Tax=Eumeta variegata TaxID=151549 RepID=A0A4C1ZU84_EUMVA|nr:hypothetical protein EVAR_64045_1 [Eumeta japonica]